MKCGVLIVRRGNWPNTWYELGESETLIGRGPSCHIPVSDQGVSREHAAVLHDGESYTVEDLQSTNGTQVNGKKVRSAELQPGDEIQIGDTIFEFTLG